MALRILVPYGIITKLMSEGFGSKPTIIKALRGADNTQRMREIRKRALELGGEIVTTVK